jgi:hypothetical protein
MEDLNQRIAAWREAKLLTDKQASAIAAFEAARIPEASAPERDPKDGKGVFLAEALGYVGAAIAVAAVVILLGNQWNSLNLGGRLGLIGLITLIVSGAGVALRGSERAPVRRLVSLLLTAGIGGVAWIVGVVSNDVLRWGASSTLLAVGVISLILSGALYRWRARALPQVAALASALIVVAAVIDRSGLDSTSTWLGLSMWAVGVAWALSGLGGWLRPVPVAVGFGSVVALVSAQIGSAGEQRLALLLVGLATAGALLACGVGRGAAYQVAIGSLGLLTFLPQVVVHVFGTAIGAMVMMLVVGLLLVVISVRLARGRSPRVEVVES